MIINVTYDSSVNKCPQESAFKACVQAVADFYESEFNDPITVNWQVGWGTVDNQSIPNGNGAESISNYTSTPITYTALRNAFVADATSGSDASAVASLPTSNPTSTNKFTMTLAEAKALGLNSATTGIDGYSGIDKSSSWVFNTTNTNGNSTLAVKGTDAFSFLAHELSEVLGRQMNFAPSDPYNSGGGYYPYDLFDYTAAGTRSFSSGKAHRYFSDDGGVSNTGQHYFNNDTNAGDPFDTLPKSTPDSFDYAGSVGAVSSADVTLMDVLGYNVTPTVGWSTAVSGDFATAGSWTGGTGPSSTTAASLNATGTAAYTVTSGASATVSSIQTTSTATLAITGGTFTDTNGTGIGINAGTVRVSGATLAAGGVFFNRKAVSINSTAILLVAGSGLVLEGGGVLSLAGVIEGAGASATLTNGSVISGSGQLGNGVMTLVNLAGATIRSKGAGALTIDTGAVAVTNLGLIKSNSAGGVVINGALVNGSTPTDHTTVPTTYGELDAAVGTLTVTGAVSGLGKGVIAGGTLRFQGTFNENVTFLTPKGALDLADSVAYTSGKITGLSGSDALLLRDISFTAGTTTASYAGTSSGGVLTVTDGTNTASLHLVGNYLSATWSLSAATGGGTMVVDPRAAPVSTTATPANQHGFVAAMASFAPPAGAHLSSHFAEAHAGGAALAALGLAQQA